MIEVLALDSTLQFCLLVHSFKLSVISVTDYIDITQTTRKNYMITNFKCLIMTHLYVNRVNSIT